MKTTSQELRKLVQFYKLKTIAQSHKPFLQGKRHVKGRGKHYGSILKKSRIINGVLLPEGRD